MALVPLITLWSCGGVVIRVRAVETKRESEKWPKVREEKNSPRNILPEKRNTRKENMTNTSQKSNFSWKDLLVFCILFLDGFLQKTPQWWFRTCTEECFCIWRNWVQLCYYVLRSLVFQPLVNRLTIKLHHFLFSPHRDGCEGAQACVFFKKDIKGLVLLTLHTHPRPQGQRTPRRCPWSCLPCRCRSRHLRCVRGRWAGCLIRAGWTWAAGPNRWPTHARLKCVKRRKQMRKEIHK